jgi:LacI family sucrose operon transcriptional repressor
MQPSDRIGVMLTHTLIQMIENADGELINNTTVDVTLIQGDTT